MAELPRLLVIMGSGETSPTMVKAHREVFERLGRPPVPAVVLDTPFGFQENAAELTARAIEYFRESVGRDVDVAGYRSEDEVGSLAHETMLARLQEARFVFAGPGSPSYALRQWRASRVPDLLAAKLRAGGAVVFASAAACTLGRVALPVYEVYKVGEAVRWLDGLDLLAEAGLTAAVIPHFNNAEGGTHDTRFCYMGERRLRLLEDQLPDGAFVLGVDEHTGCVLDLGAGTATVVGIGVVTVRRGGRATELPAGTTVGIDELGTESEAPAAVRVPSSAEGAAAPPPARSPILDDVERLEAAFETALAAGDGPGAVEAILQLDDVLAAWSTETFSSDEMAKARGALRSMVVRLGERAAQGLRDPREVIGPFVEALLRLRAELRAARQFELADAVRDRLVDLGVEVRDTPTGSEWVLS